ncbi:MAG: tRNA pseudouridine(38-40) synthase TruA [Ruminococcus sp.]|jgi:tRNA pseudouridine38-40 synthase|nr:tRNA pseudouridine(38-40) synthase TruA [Ruminococcus sp.]
MNRKILMSYRGTAYSGFQRQKNAVGVQNVIEDALFSMTGEHIGINGVSRTDTGVHADEYCFSFESDSAIPDKNFVTGLNSLLPLDMAVFSCETVSPDFHARYSCKAKEYVYLIRNERIRNPFDYDISLLYGLPIDETALDKELQSLLGTHDFASFCGSKGLRDNTVRTIMNISLTRNENFVKLLVKGDGFLYNMVRIITGTLLEINEGKKSFGSMPAILAACDRNAAGRTAPPEGLHLHKIYY